MQSVHISTRLSSISPPHALVMTLAINTLQLTIHAVAIVVGFAPFSQKGHVHCAYTRSLTHSLIQNHKHINNALAARRTVFSRSFGRLINKNLCPCLNIYFYAKMYANESYFRIFGGGNGDGGKIGVIIRECIKACAAICQH